MKATFPGLAGVLAVSGLVFALPSSARAGQFDIPDPAGADSAFGTSITVLHNGNFVVTDPEYDAPGPVPDVGAVYLYDGVTLEIISTLTGSTAGDQVGRGGITVLANENFVVSSPQWDHGGLTDVGAVTWGNGTTGASGEVSAANSLIGSTPSDEVGFDGVTALANGNFVVSSSHWASGAATDAGTVTWGSGSAGLTGVVSEANSLVGSTANDQVGRLFSGDGGARLGVTALANGNFAVSSPFWDNGAAEDAGAVTWGSGTAGVVGAVGAANSLVGSSVVTHAAQGTDNSSPLVVAEAIALLGSVLGSSPVVSEEKSTPRPRD